MVAIAAETKRAVLPYLYPVIRLCVGYPDGAKPATIKPRLPQTAVLHQETYNSAQSAAIAQYNQTMQQVYELQHMNVTGDWADHSLKRVATAEAWNGRDHLKETL